MSPNDAKHQFLRPYYRTRQRHPPRKVIKYELIVCLLWGEGRAGTCRPNLGTPEQTKIYLFAMGRAEVRVAFNDRAERYYSRNLVTERDVICLCDHVTERSVIGLRNLVTERARRSLLTKKVNPERPSNGNQIGAPKTNQDFVCLRKKTGTQK